ncbi:MAG TPA: hypothetical protein VFP72_14750 [Kineosporiaceae bacterium]|nr:hypothetical protein [Kineosporiaceae bacterium]
MGRVRWARVLLAWAGVAVIAVDEVSTFVPGYPVLPIALIVLLFVFGIFLLLPGALEVQQEVRELAATQQAAASGPTEGNVFRRYDAEMAQQQERRDVLLARIPTPAMAFTVAMGMAGAGLAVSSFVQLRGNPEVIDGRYYSNSHGVLTSLSLAEYHHQLGLHVRAFGGIALVMLLASAALTFVGSGGPLFQSPSAHDSGRPPSSQ